MTEQNEQAPASPAPLRAGVIGLGVIGGGVAVNLARGGYLPTVYDVRPDAAEKLAGVPAPVATPGQVAEASDVVLIAVVNAAQARDVLIGDHGILTTGRDGLVIVLLSTIAVDAVRELSAICAEHGAALLDAGVTQAGDGKLVVMLGGPRDVAERIAPVLDTFSKAVIHCGGIGAGMVTKLARNAVTYANWAVMREAVSIAVAGGVAPEVLLDVMQRAGDGGPTPTSMIRKQLGDDPLSEPEAAFVNTLSQKDLAAAQEFAGAAGVETPIIDVTRPAMPAVLACRFADSLPEDRRERGLTMITRVYGQQLGSQLAPDTSIPALADTIDHLFGEIWGRPHLTTRDRRLLALGATSQLGRGDLLEIQLRGALENGEFTTAQLREMELFLNYYAGVENGGTVVSVIEKLVAENASAAN